MHKIILLIYCKISFRHCLDYILSHPVNRGSSIKGNIMNKNKDEERGEGIRVKGRVSWLSKFIKHKNYKLFKLEDCNLFKSETSMNV